MNSPAFDWILSAEFWAMSTLLLIFFVGFIATILPVAPGNLIVLGGVILHRLWVPHCSVSWTIIGFMTALSVLAIPWIARRCWSGAMVHLRGAWMRTMRWSMR